jgi:hypothetical protein
MDIHITGLIFALTFSLTFFTIAWVANWTLRIRKELRSQPSSPSRLIAASVFHVAPWALVALASLVWHFQTSSEFPEMISAMVSAPIALFWLYKIDMGKKKNISKANQNGPHDVA